MCDEILKEEESEQKKKKKAEVDGNATADSDAKPAESSSGAAEKEVKLDKNGVNGTNDSHDALSIKSASCDTDVKLKSSQVKGEIEKKLEENGSATSAIGQKGQEDVPVKN